MTNSDLEPSPELVRLARLGWKVEALGPVVDGVQFVGGPVRVDYPEGGLAALGLEGGSGYWFDFRARAIIDALGHTTGARSLWDIGAGAGSMSKRLVHAGYEVVAVEPLADGARAIAGQEIGPVFCGSLEQLNLPNGCIRIVGLFDVIEHIDEPIHLMSEVLRVLEPGGVVVLTVPAHPALWSDEDEVAGHKRRYRRSDLNKFMRTAGFSEVVSEYLFTSLVIPALFIRVIPYKLGRRRSAEAILSATANQLSPNPGVDRSIRRLLSIERAVSKRVDLPIGTSIMGVYRLL